MNAPCTTPVPISFFWGCSASHFSRAPFQCIHHGPMFSSAHVGPAPLCETQFPDGIHFITQKDQPQGKLGSRGTLLAKVRLSNIAQAEPLPGPLEVHRDKRETNNIHGLCAQLLPIADHLQVP